MERESLVVERARKENQREKEGTKRHGFIKIAQKKKIRETIGTNEEFPRLIQNVQSPGVSNGGNAPWGGAVYEEKRPLQGKPPKGSFETRHLMRLKKDWGKKAQKKGFSDFKRTYPLGNRENEGGQGKERTKSTPKETHWARKFERGD